MTAGRPSKPLGFRSRRCRGRTSSSFGRTALNGEDLIPSVRERRSATRMGSNRCRRQTISTCAIRLRRRTTRQLREAAKLIVDAGWASRLTSRGVDEKHLITDPPRSPGAEDADRRFTLASLAEPVGASTHRSLFWRAYRNVASEGMHRHGSRPWKQADASKKPGCGGDGPPLP